MSQIRCGIPHVWSMNLSGRQAEVCFHRQAALKVLRVTQGVAASVALARKSRPTSREPLLSNFYSNFCLLQYCKCPLLMSCSLRYRYNCTILYTVQYSDLSTPPVGGEWWLRKYCFEEKTKADGWKYSLFSNQSKTLYFP